MKNRSAIVSVLQLRINAMIVLAAAFILIYLGTNHLALRPPRLLPLFGWEKSIPFLPWTIIFYLVAYVQAAGIFLVIDRRHIKKALLGMLGIIAVSGLFFILWPTVYPRPPLPVGTDNASRILYGFLAAIDRPQNCFPSLHVAVSLFAVFILWRQSRRFGLFLLVLSILGIISTLTLKQHYFIDVLGGFAVASLFYLIFFYDSR